MARLNNTLENIEQFTPESLPNQTLGKKGVIKRLVKHDLFCKEYPHVIIKFQPLGVLHIFIKDRKQPLLHTYSINHNANTDQWFIDISPSILNEPEIMELKITTVEIQLVGANETLHLNKYNYGN